MRAWFVVVAATAACGRIAFDPTGGDARSDTSDGAPPCTSFGAWANVEHLDTLASPANDWSPALSPDTLVLVFDSGRLGGDDLFVSTRATSADAFGAPAQIANLNSATAHESNPSWVGDGIYYTSFDPMTSTTSLRNARYLGGGMFGDSQLPADPSCDAFAMSSDQLELFCTINPLPMQYNLKHATRPSTSSVWTIDAVLDSYTPSGGDSGWPSFDEVRQTLYFERQPSSGGPEIAMITRASSTTPFGVATALPELGSRTGDPEIARDGTVMIFASDRAGTVGLTDLYMATRACQ